LPDRTIVRRQLLALVLVGALAAAGCGGDAEDDITSGRVPESGTLPPTTTTEPEEVEETTTTVDSESPAVTLPAEAGAVIQIDVVEGEATINALVAGGNPTSEGTIQVDVDTPVQVQVTSDQPDRVNVHGYNLVAEVGPGVPGTLDFVADTPGLFLIELEDSHLPLFRLNVAEDGFTTDA
jgi:hypothetical protein